MIDAIMYKDWIFEKILESLLYHIRITLQFEKKRKHKIQLQISEIAFCLFIFVPIRFFI